MIKLFLNLLFQLLFFFSGKKKWKLKIFIQNILDKKYFRFTHKNKDIYFKIDSLHCLKRYSTILTKEKNTISWINNMRINEVMWDIGANIGIYSVYAAKLKKINVISFEPVTNSYNTLLKNIKINKLQNKIIALPMALSDKSCIAYMNFKSDHSGSAGHIYSEKLKNNNKFETTISLRSDFLIKNLNLPIPNYIKIDTDGNEIDILESMSHILKFKKVKSICIENQFDKYTNLREKKILNFVKKFKFQYGSKEILTAGYNMFFYK